MARERPIKLHIKDGKDTTFRLIGPKGRVLNSLNWDGERLKLMDAFNVEDVQDETEGSDMENTVVARNKIGETESEAVERVQKNHPDKEVVFEDPDTPPPAVPEPTESSEGSNPDNIFEDEVPASPADEPEADNKVTVEVGEETGVDDVSGESEAQITDEELADILTEDNLNIPDVEESEDVPEEKDSEAEDVEEKKKPN